MDHPNNSRGRGRKNTQFYQPHRKPDINQDGAASTKFERNITGPENNRVPNEKHLDYNDSNLSRMKKPEQVFYTAKPMDGYQHQHNNYNARDLRHTSEPRAVVPGNGKPNYYNSIDHSRDTRSVEPNREKKPPINRGGNMPYSSLQSAQAANRLPSNFEALPPRLKRKILADLGLPEDFLEKQLQFFKKEDNRQYDNQGGSYNNNRPQQNWSQTLPGRSGRDGGGSMYRNNYNDSTGGGRSRSRSSDRRFDENYYKPRSRNPSNDNKGGGDAMAKSWRHDPGQQQAGNFNNKGQSNNNNNNNNRFQNQRKSFQKVDIHNMESVESIEKNLKSTSMVAKQQQELQQHQQQKQSRQEEHQIQLESQKQQPQQQQRQQVHQNQLKPTMISPAAAKQKSPGRDREDMDKQSAFEISYFNWAEDVEETMATKETVKPSPAQNKPASEGAYRRNRRNSNNSNDGASQNFEKSNKNHQQQTQQRQAKSHPPQYHPQPVIPQQQPVENFKVPAAAPFKSHKPKNRSRQNSQSSVYESREVSAERSAGYYQRPNASNVNYSGNSRNRRNSGHFNASRENSSERYRDNSRSRFGNMRSRRSSERFNSVSRETSNDRNNWHKPGGGVEVGSETVANSWRSRPKDDMISKATEKINKDRENAAEMANIAEMTRQFEDAVDLRKGGPGVLVLPQPAPQQSRVLFDPNNPEKPIVLKQAPTRAYTPPEHLHEVNNVSSEAHKKNLMLAKASLQDQYINVKPDWYNPNSEGYRSVKRQNLIQRMEDVDMQMQLLIGSGGVFKEWKQFWTLRVQLQEIMEQLLKHEMKFCQHENVEHHCWKLLYYNVIELLRKSIMNDPQNKMFYMGRIEEIVDSGNVFLTHLLDVLERTYKFRLSDYLGDNAGTNTKGLGYIGLALVSAQKLFLFLGDLARYSQQMNETQDYTKSKEWYMKAQQVVPKNGRPYNQLALLSVYSKCKLEAVYYYMRSLMSSNPFHSSRESLIALFDETRKKYESLQRKRDEKNRLRLKEKEHKFDGGNLRRETWIHPEGGRRVHRTAPLDPLAGNTAGDSSDEEELKHMDLDEVNKRFVTSFLHVQGKLITKIGMETFTQCATQMLREFHLLINYTPVEVALGTQPLLQLMALNMFAIDCTQLRDPSIAPGARSEIQECAISVGLLMFGIILEKLINLIKGSLDPLVTTKPSPAVITINTPLITLGGEKLTATVSHGGDTKHGNKSKPAKCDDKISERLCDSNDKTRGQTTNVESNKNSICNQNENDMSTKKRLILSEHVSNLLPAVKVWCDWMLCHTTLWNPPPFCLDYKIGTKGSHDPWTGLANLMTILDAADTNRGIISLERHKDFGIVRLEEDITLAYFTPLMYNSPEPIFCHSNENKQKAQNALRLQKLIFFGTDFLCSCNPPVLKKVIDRNATKFISIVQDRTEGASDTEIMLESFSDDDDASETIVSVKNSQRETPQEDTVSDINRVINQISSEANGSQGAKSNGKQNEAASEIRRLLRRKDELERKQKMQDKYNQRLQDILNHSTVALNIEVRPKFLVPDTNCFVDYMKEIKAIVDAHPLYQLMVPIVVINELEGLSRGFKANPMNAPPTIKNPLAPTLTIFSTAGRNKVVNNHSPEHAVMVADASQQALSFLKSKNPAIKCITTKGSVLSSSIFTVEDEGCEQKSNDDKILDTALNLCKNSKAERKGEMRCLVRDVVLLTEDRNLRVKALSNDLPVRELPDFIKWAGLGSQLLQPNRR